MYLKISSGLTQADAGCLAALLAVIISQSASVSHKHMLSWETQRSSYLYDQTIWTSSDIKGCCTPFDVVSRWFNSDPATFVLFCLIYLSSLTISTFHHQIQPKNCKSHASISTSFNMNCCVLHSEPICDVPRSVLRRWFLSMQQKKSGVSAVLTSTGSLFHHHKARIGKPLWFCLSVQMES